MIPRSDISRDEELVISAVLVNWQQADRTIEAVRALERQSFPINYVIIVDNGSMDNSEKILKASLPEAHVFRNQENVGFGSGCNIGITQAISLGSDYILLINNDALPEKHLIQKMIFRIRHDSMIGVVGACIHDPTDNVAKHAGTVMNPISFTCRNTLSEVELNANSYSWITGASMLLNVTALKVVGIFDPGYFMYWEDADLCMRLRRFGFKMAVASDAIVEHEAGTSSNQIEIKRYSWHLTSQLRWVKTNYKIIAYGIFIVYCRHFIKSIISLNARRFLMTWNSLFVKKRVNT